VCVCVCERERERERIIVIEGERLIVSVCERVIVREGERGSVGLTQDPLQTTLFLFRFECF
jgi:hypothetical protein